MDDKLQREYYQDIGYKPFLFFMIFGITGEELEIFCSEEKGNYWLHTRGMAEFGRPDIGIEGVPEEKIHDYNQIINQMIFYGGRGLFFDGKAKLHTFDGKSFVVQPEFVNDFDNEDYNNAYYNVTVLEE